MVKELGRLAQNQTGGSSLEASLVCFHGAVECGKLLISSERLRKYPVSLCVSVTSRPLAGGNRIGHYDRHVTIGPSTNFLSMLVPYRPELGGFALTLTLHTLIDRLAILLRKHHTPEAHIDNLHTKPLRSHLQLFQNLRHRTRAVIADDIDRRGCAQYTTD